MSSEHRQLRRAGCLGPAIGAVLGSLAVGALGWWGAVTIAKHNNMLSWDGVMIASSGCTLGLFFGALLGAFVGDMASQRRKP